MCSSGQSTSWVVQQSASSSKLPSRSSTLHSTSSLVSRWGTVPDSPSINIPISSPAHPSSDHTQAIRSPHCKLSTAPTHAGMCGAVLSESFGTPCTLNVYPTACIHTEIRTPTWPFFLENDSRRAKARKSQRTCGADGNNRRRRRGNDKWRRGNSGRCVEARKRRQTHEGTETTVDVWRLGNDSRRKEGREWKRRHSQFYCNHIILKNAFFFLGQ